MKTSAVGMEPSKVNQTRLSHHPYILCHFANYTHHKTLYMHIGLFHPLNECIANYKTTHIAMSYSAATKVHSTYHTPTIHTESALLMHSTTFAYKKDHICHAQ